MDALQKLTIEAYGDASFNSPLSLKFTADFNPSEYSLTRSNTFTPKSTPGHSRPETTYSSGNNDSLKLQFWFDGSGATGKAGSVKRKVDLFLSLMSYRGGIDKPPYVKLKWGDFTFQGCITKATAQFTLFNRQGQPIRAKIDASFQEVVSAEDRIAREKKSSPTVNRVWHVREGDRLDQIAFESYGDTRYWYQLAVKNSLLNPRRLVPGEVLHLPRLVR